MKKNKTKKALATLAIAGMAVTMLPFNAFADGVTTARLYGTDRIGTAVQVADAGWTTADTAILAPSANANLVDALAAAPLAGKNSPILLTDNNTLSAATQAELTKLGVKNVYVVGAVSQTVVDQVKAMGLNTTVLKGADRIGTATQISAKLAAPAGSFVVGYGALADALSVASYAAANNYSILVANPDGSLPASEKAYLGSKVYIIGGPTLVADIPGATRLYGQDRFATNQAVINALTYKYDKVYVANGTSAHLVDSLVASSLAAETSSPIVLGDTSTAKAASDVHAKLTAAAVVTALGGESVVPTAVVNQIAYGTSPVVTPGNVSISNVKVTGQTVGDGSTNSPAVAPINDGMTVSATISGPNTANSTVTYLVSTSNNITAKDASGSVLNATTLTSPVVIGNDTFDATYTVPADANGNSSVTFSSTASSDQAFNVVVQAPFYNNGQPVRSDEIRAQWGVPGTLVLSPLYTSGSPYNLNFSSSSNETNGLVPVVATYLPVSGSTTTPSDQQVKFTMTAQGDPGSATAFYTTSTGAGTVGQNASVGNGVTTAYYNATTDANGQALVYINANQPTTNSVANLGASIEVGVQAQLVNGGGSTTTGYYKWQSVAQPSQVANLSPSQMLNPTGITTSADTVVPDSAEKANSGSQITISGQVQDAAGNPVPNVRMALQDYDVKNGGYSNNIQNDAFVQSGTSTLFSSTNYPLITTDANGSFSFVVTANVPVTQSVYNSQTKYYLYYVPNTVSLSNGQNLPKDGITQMTFLGNSNSGNYINLVWQQGQTVQAVAMSGSPLQSQYSTLTDVPSTNQSFSSVIGDHKEIYVAGFNQNGQMVAPTKATDSGNQFAGYGLDYNLTLPSGVTIQKFGNGTDTLPWSAGTPIEAVDLHYFNNTLIMVSYTDASGSVHTVNQTLNDPAAYDGSGQLALYAIAANNASDSVSGAINATVSAYDGLTDTWNTTNAQGAGSSSITANFTKASVINALGVTGSIQNLLTYGPLLQTNAAPPNTTTVNGTSYKANSLRFNTSDNASFVLSGFNNYVSISPIPTEGITYTMNASKSAKFEMVDGYQLQSESPTATVNIQHNGLVSVDNRAIWSAPASGSTVVGYQYVTNATSPTTAPSLYVLVYTPGTSGTDTYALCPVTSGTTGAAVATWSVPSTARPAGYEGYLGFKIDAGGYLTVMDNNDGYTGTDAVSTNAVTLGGTAGVTAGYVAPVQAIAVNVGDEYSESSTVSVTNSVNSQTATVTAAFTSASGGLYAVNSNPASINFANGSSQTVTFTAVDKFGNPLANQSIYVQGSNVPGLWITQVNGTAITDTINLAPAGQNTNFSSVNAPVPLFVYNTEGLTAPDYNNVYIPGSITAYNLSSGTNPYVALVTGVDGTVSFTVQNGNVQYWANGGTNAAVNTVDVGHQIVGGTLNFYSGTPSSTNNIGSISVNVSGGATN